MITVDLISAFPCGACTTRLMLFYTKVRELVAYCPRCTKERVL